MRQAPAPWRIAERSFFTSRTEGYPEGDPPTRRRLASAGMAILLFAAVLTAGLDVPAQAGHQCEGHYPAGTKCAKSSVSIDYRSDEKRLVGDIDSHMRWCVRKRTVVLRRVRKGSDTVLARTKSGKRGWWAFNLGPKRGRFYTVARYKERSYGIDGHDICYRAESRRVRLR